MMRRPTPRSDAIWFIVQATVPDCEITLIDPATGCAGGVVPRDRLDEATLELAEEIAKNEPFVVQATKRAANRVWDVAGFRAAMAANTELDVMIETANLPARDEFRRITQEQGLKAAIAWRDARFRGDGG